jgi:hypothetical protein
VKPPIIVMPVKTGIQLAAVPLADTPKRDTGLRR